MVRTDAAGAFDGRQAASRGISRQGDQRLRKLFALAASTIMRHLRTQPQRATTWQRGILIPGQTYCPPRIAA
jgi:transposase